MHSYESSKPLPHPLSYQSSSSNSNKDHLANCCTSSVHGSSLPPGINSGYLVRLLCGPPKSHSTLLKPDSETLPYLSVFPSQHVVNVSPRCTEVSLIKPWGPSPPSLPSPLHRALALFTIRSLPATKCLTLILLAAPL